MNIAQTLEQLCTGTGVSGYETAISKQVSDLLKPFCTNIQILHGNVIGTVGTHDPKKKHILLDAHLDQVGMVVTYITEEGFVKVGAVGGLDLRLLPAQHVRLHGTHAIPGVICTVPPHLMKGEETVPDWSAIYVDTGYSKEELEHIISLGDCVSFDSPFQLLTEQCVSAPSLDDRCGIVAILQAVEQLQNETLPCNLTVLFSSQEELGERGAKIAAYQIHPDIALAVDVSFARSHHDDPVKCGILGDGPMIGISPSLSRSVNDELIATAKALNLPWQPEVMAGTTGTNADQFSGTRNGIQTGTVSIPLRYMHTPSELIALKDVQATADLLAAYVRGSL